MSDNEREQFVDRDPEVVQGEDEIPRQPAPPLDPYIRPSPARGRASSAPSTSYGGPGYRS
jgi:hypothetical protein